MYLFRWITGHTEKQLLTQLKAGTLTRIKLLDAYRSDLSQELAMKLLDNATQNFNVFSKRHEIIKDGFDAHFNKKYNLSIPCLFPQVEGVLKEVGKRLSPTPSVIPDGYDRRLAFEIQEHALEFNAFLSETYKGGAQDDEFSRDPILHGANPNYGKEEWSLLLVLTRSLSE